MSNRILSIITLFLTLGATTLSAQKELPEIPNAEIIKGTAFISYPSYSGAPFLNENFMMGEIELSDGTKVSNIGLRYSSYRDEVVYYNTFLSAQIVIDKISLKGFSFTDQKGVKRIFRHQHYDDHLNDERYFEVLSDGKISLLAFRKVNLEQCDPSYDIHGLAYKQTYYYYVYVADKGYSPLNITRNSLLSKLDKQNQKLAKRILRKHRLVFTDEASLVLAWNILKENGIVFNI